MLKYNSAKPPVHLKTNSEIMIPGTQNQTAGARRVRRFTARRVWCVRETLAAAMQKLKLPGVVINLQDRCVDNRP
jgi:hypothetical protein